MNRSNSQEKVMATWKIVSAHRVHGLAFAVNMTERFYRRSIGVRPQVARKMALRMVRACLSHAIDTGEFFHA